jgi:hypothetical protein
LFFFCPCVLSYYGDDKFAWECTSIYIYDTIMKDSGENDAEPLYEGVGRKERGKK